MPEVGDRITHIRVCNNNPFPLSDHYDGVRYVFAPEKTVTIPAEVASHIFGYREDASEDDMFRHVARRFGWNTPDVLRDQLDRMYFDQIDIKPVIMKLVEVPDEEGDELPALPKPAENVRRPVGRPKLHKPEGTPPAP